MADQPVPPLGSGTTLRGAFHNGAGDLQPGIGPVASGFAIPVAPSTQTTYTLSVTNNLGISSISKLMVTPKRPAGAFIPAGDLSEPRINHNATRLLDGRVLLAGGSNNASGDNAQDADLYDPVTGTFSGPGIQTGVGRSATLLFDGRVLLAGGLYLSAGSARYVGTIGFWDPVNGSGVGPLVQFDRFNHSATLLLDGRVLFAGGNQPLPGQVPVITANPVSSALIFDPNDWSIAPVGSMTSTAGPNSALLLPDGRVLVESMGGAQTLDVFDPDIQRFSALPLPPGGGSGHPLLLPDGRVLCGNQVLDPATMQFSPSSARPQAIPNTLLGDGSVFSGYIQTTAFYDTQIFDPASGSTLATDPPLVNRYNPTATLLGDGRLLVTGGTFTRADGSSEAAGSAEIFDPKTPLLIQPNGGFALGGGTVSFTPSGSAASLPILWSCTGGEIDSSGRWTAPIKPGIYWVEATNQYDASIRAVARYQVPPSKLRLEESNITVLKHCQATLHATMSGVANQAVTWALIEGSIAGNITQTGVYTAGNTPGIYHVIVTSVLDPSQMVTGIIKVPSLGPPVISQFSADKTSVALGSPITFSWDITGDGVDPITVSISRQDDPNSGNLTGTTWTTVPAKHTSSPVEMATFTLSAMNSHGGATRSLSVNIGDPQALILAPSKALLLKGDSQQFTATSWLTGQPAGNVAWSMSGTTIGSISTTGLLTSTGTGTTDVQAQSLDAPNAPVTKATVYALTRSAPTLMGTMGIDGPLPMRPGRSVNLIWSCSNATSLILRSSAGDVWDVSDISPWGGYASFSVSPNRTTTYTLEGSNALGSVSTTTTVPVMIGIGISPFADSGYIYVNAAASKQFTAVANGIPGVVWSIKEADGGTITQDGLYTAPKKSGIFTVVATSISDPVLVDSVRVFVTYSLNVYVQNGSQPNSSVTIATGSSVSFNTGYGGPIALWSILEPSGGTITGSSGSSSSVYTAPQTPGVYRVVATSYSNSNQIGAFQVIVVTPITITPSTLRMPTGSNQAFGYTLLAPTNRVTWSVTGGSITSEGVLTAPTVPGTYSVTVTSVDDPSRFATAIITVYEEIVTVPVCVAVSPSTVSLYASGTSIFGSTVSAGAGSSLAVTWSATGGTIIPIGENQGYYTAPDQAGTYTVTATSLADPSKSASLVVTVTVVDVSLQISPSTVELGPGESYKFGSSIQVTGSSDASLQWRAEAGSVTPYPDGGALYKAPLSEGAYKVSVISNANPKVFAMAVVTVKAGKPFISVSPSETRAAFGARQSFTVQGVGLSGGVRWSILEAGGGAISSDGTYTAPNAQGTFTVVAEGTSLGGDAVYGAAQISVGALVIQAPAQLLLFPGDSFLFAARQIDSAVDPLAWSVDEGIAGGTIANDGTYTAPLQAGIYHVRVSNGNGEFAVQEVIVTLVDAIVISPKVEILEEGDYTVSVSLQASNAKRTIRKINLHFAVGIQEPELTFKAGALKTDLGVDGPYGVMDVRIEKFTPDDLVPADTPMDLGLTAAYRLDRLQRPWISFGGDVSVQALDLNGNGLADQLRVSFVATLVSMGSYQWKAALVDADGLVIAHAYAGPAQLVAGPNTLQLIFDGAAINAHGKDGPYFLRNVVLEGPVLDGSGDWSGAILGFTASQFEVTSGTPVYPAVAPRVISGASKAKGVPPQQIPKYRVRR
jgi:hypothetical protein